MTTTKTLQNPSRRRFIKNTSLGAGGLIVGFHLPVTDGPAFAKSLDTYEPLLANTFILISQDNQIRVLCNHAEMGNGCYTTMSMMVAEELDLDWQQIQVEAAPTAPEYNHAWWGVYLTGGSSSTPSSWLPFRQAGAKTRVMMLNAAARYWNLDNSDGLSTDKGHVIHPDKTHSLTYGELTEVIKQHQITPPEEVTLKSPEDFQFIGRDIKRIEGQGKVTGEAVFGIDIRQPNLHYASIARSPVYQGKVKSVDSSAAEKIKGVVSIKPISAGMVVIATSYWAARKAKNALKIEWDPGDNANYSSEQLLAEYRELCEQPGLVAEDIGDTETALKNSAKTLQALYEVLLLAHATMEPLNCTARVKDGRCEIWAGTQFQGNDREVVARLLGIQPEAVTIHRTLMGGGFGRRASIDADFIVEAVEAARGENFPLQVIWSREEDIANAGYYRPIFAHKLTGGLDEEGKLVAWHQRLAGQSIMQGNMFEAVYMPGGIDVYSVDGCVKQPYKIPNHRVESHNPPKVGYMPLWWRSVGQTHTGFAYECFLDEMAEAGDQDALQLRRELCADNERMSAVLKMTAEKSDWGKPLAKGQGRGLAAREAFGSFLTQVADITMIDDETFKVNKVTCVIDCGYAVNPRGVISQIQGGIVYGLTAAAFGDIEMENGQVKQSNFHDYTMMRMSHMPEVDVHIINGTGSPTGVGEPGTAPIAPAVINAIYSATGKRIRRLPISKHGLTMV